MRILALLLAVMAIGCREQGLVRSFDAKCGQPCYGGKETNANKGICTSGNWKCTDVDSEPVCEGWVAPQETQCNGLDNNCDGKIDSAWRECSSACGKSTQFCTEGVWGVCHVQQPMPEVCNGLDDDCNGMIDDVVYTNPYCYSGPTSSIGKGECRPGFFICHNGVQECNGQVLPKSETCNGKDDDCDGTVDEGTNSKPKDIVICVDESGSMSTKIDKVKATTQNWVNKYGARADLKFGLCSCPGHIDSEDNRVILRQNLTNAATFNSAVGQLYAGNTGWEPTIDAVYMIADPSNPLGINWTPGAERVVVEFTDEEAQSGSISPPVTAAEAGALAADAGIKLYEFIDFQYAASFDPMLIPTNGTKFNINGSYSEIETNLDSIVNQCN